MKTIIRILFLFGIIVSIAFCCKKGENNQDGDEIVELEILSFKDITGKENYCDLKDQKDLTKEFHLVITNQEDFQANVTCSNDELPEIDFMKWSVIAIHVYTPHTTAHIVSQKLLRNDTELKYFYEVYYTGGILTKPGFTTFFSVIPVIPENYQVIFNLEYIVP